MTHQVALSSVLSMVARVERLDQNSLLHGQGSAFAGGCVQWESGVRIHWW